MDSSGKPNLLPKLPLLLIVFHLSRIPLSVSSSEFPINVWPKPTHFSWAEPFVATFISPNFSISAADHPHLTPAVSRYHHLIQTERYQPIVTPSTTNINPAPSAPFLLTLKIDVADVAAPLGHGVNESYTLIIPSGSPAAHLSAATVWAAMRGLETFSQLVWGDPPRAAAGVAISDSPIYAHRGLLLDTSRNYYPVEDILRTIRAMGMNKMNVFHWHITDSHSFPLILPSEPDLGSKGSYGPDMTYSHHDVMRIVESGFQHGVRVLPEIDFPGHTGSWAEAYPEIVTCAGLFWWPAGAKWSDRLASEPGTGQLNPLNPKTYEVVRNVLRDAVELFPERFFHGGGDEVAPSCWKTDPMVRSFLSSGGTPDSLLEKFVNATLPFITSLGRRVIYWEDVLFGADVRVRPSILPFDDVVLQTWNSSSPNNTKRIVQSGYPVIVSSSEFYYLDCGHGDFLGNESRYDRPPGTDQGDGGSWCGPFKTWQMIYNYDIAHGLSEEERRLVLGGEVALWSEQADPAVLDARLWPRAAAMAEALWSGNRDRNGRKRSAEATDRLNQWRHRMYVSRGISAEPIQPLWCLRNPGMCNAANPL